MKQRNNATIPTLDKFVDVILSVEKRLQSIAATEYRTKTAQTVELQDSVGDVR